MFLAVKMCQRSVTSFQSTVKLCTVCDTDVFYILVTVPCSELMKKYGDILSVKQS